jgi:hypothetical protein
LENGIIVNWKSAKKPVDDNVTYQAQSDSVTKLSLNHADQARVPNREGVFFTNLPASFLTDVKSPGDYCVSRGS